MSLNQIKIIKKNSDLDKKNLLIIGVFHGDEPQGEYFINSFLKKDLKPVKNNITYVPRLNFNNARKNRNGVDLNRNFPTKNWIRQDTTSDYFGGSEPNSERETKLIVNLISTNDFDAIITIHAPYRTVNYDGPAENLAKKISDILGYPTSRDIGYPTPGSFGTYCGIEKNIPTVTIEIDDKEDLEKLNLKFEKLFLWLQNKY